MAKRLSQKELDQIREDFQFSYPVPDLLMHIEALEAELARKQDIFNELLCSRSTSS